MNDIAIVANDTSTHLRALALVNRLRELPAQIREALLASWENAVEATLHPVVLVISPRDAVAAAWIRVVDEAGGTGRWATGSDDLLEFLYQDHVQAILLDADYLDPVQRMVAQMRAWERRIPVVLVTDPRKLWVQGKDGDVRRSAPAPEELRRTLAGMLQHHKGAL
jgi:hypothetical protein